LSAVQVGKFVRRSDRRVRMLKNPSPWLSHDALVGVKWKVTRGLRAFHASRSGVLCRGVINDCVRVLLGVLSDNLLREGQEVSASERVGALARHPSRRDFERRVQVDDSVALVVVRVVLDLPFRKRLRGTSVEFVPALAPTSLRRRLEQSRSPAG
jgi:hypothetical protein